MPMKKLVHNFIHCGILGWCLEISFTALNSFRRREFTLNGNTSVWMFPIYGMAAFLAPVCRIVKKRHFLVRGFLYAVLIFIGEFVTGSLPGFFLNVLSKKPMKAEPPRLRPALWHVRTFSPDPYHLSLRNRYSVYSMSFSSFAPLLIPSRYNP